LEKDGIALVDVNSGPATRSDGTLIGGRNQERCEPRQNSTIKKKKRSIFQAFREPTETQGRVHRNQSA
jgi:hypothetical protein